ncbi:hypothetical protein AC249_AIPGENE10091 [Exaiptasia diaphana]|nr:hypothetical protein AC249_AIPGENE10091 [Exaiptasia diaphana]
MPDLEQVGLINRRGIIIPDPPETDKYGALGTTISSQTHVSPNGVKETVHRFDKKMPPKLTEDSVTDSGAEQEDTLKPDSEKGIVKLSSV